MPAVSARLGQALVDRRLYVQEVWTKDAARCRAAHIPEDVTFATKPAIVRTMLANALDRGVPCAWVLADAAYGGDYQTRRMLEERRQPYVLAIRSNHTLRMLTDQGLLQTAPKEMAAELAGDSLAGACRRRRCQDPQALRPGTHCSALCRGRRLCPLRSYTKPN